MKRPHILLSLIAGMLFAGLLTSQNLNAESKLDRLVEAAPNEPVLLKPGSDRYHELDCTRLGGKTGGMDQMTLAEAAATGATPCGRCTRRLIRKYKVYDEPTKVNNNWEAINDRQSRMSQWPKRGERARKRRAKAPEVTYDPNTTVYQDALWMRVHAEECPMLILKEEKETMTLAQADKEGWRIGESGQSGRGNCCFKGYHREHPRKELPGDITFFGNYDKNSKKHLAGCHRFWMGGNEKRHSLKWWIEHGFEIICQHDRERGPSLTTVSERGMQILQSRRGKPFTPPAGWEPEAYTMDQLPSEQSMDIIAQQVLSAGNGIQELPFDDPVTSVEQFVTMRFFFPVSQWLALYQVYRGTGDERVLNTLLESARHYNELSKNYLSAAQLKARDPEGMAYMLSMALTAKIQLERARKYPETVSPDALNEAEDFLQTMVAVLDPIIMGNTNLDPEMGIPQDLADDFRNRASNRATNGIGTIATLAAALQHYQVLKGTTTLQPTIDRYRKMVAEYIEHYISNGHLCNKLEGEPMFVYPYGQEPNPRVVDGCKVFNRPEDGGHYTHCLQGLTFIYQATPELGVDDEFMTAIANAVHYNATTAQQKYGNKVAGLLQCPTGYANHKKKMRGKNYNVRDRFGLLYAFRDDLYPKVDEAVGYDWQRAMLYAMYLKALSADRSLIHLAELR